MGRMFKFVEPHPTGGRSEITISEEKIVECMKKNYPKMSEGIFVSDEDLIADFCTIHWAQEITKNKEEKILNNEKRIDWDEYFMCITETVGLRGSCDRGRSGAIIVKDKKILTTGYVGSPPGLPHCDEVGHKLITVINEKGKESKHCIRTIHAEENAILQAAEFGISVKGGTIYCKMVPCYRCAMKIVRVGIVRVVSRFRYHGDEDSLKIFDAKNIDLEVINNEVLKY